MGYGGCAVVETDRYEEMQYLLTLQFLKEELGKEKDPEQIKRIEREIRRTVEEWNRRHALKGVAMNMQKLGAYGGRASASASASAPQATPKKPLVLPPMELTFKDTVVPYQVVECLPDAAYTTLEDLNQFQRHFQKVQGVAMKPLAYFGTPRPLGSRLGVPAGSLSIEVLDEDGLPVDVIARINYPSTSEDVAIVGGAMSFPVEPQQLGDTVIQIVPPEGYAVPDPIRITLKTGPNEVQVVLAKGFPIPVPVAIGGGLVLLGLGALFF